MWEKIIELTKKNASYLRQYTNIFQHLNLPNILTKPKCIPSKKMDLNLQNTYIVYSS